MKVRLVFLTVLVLLFGIYGVRGDYIPDSMGVKFLPRYYSRIVSLAPSVTEILVFLGASNRIVGTTRYCNLPTEKVGGMYDPDIEKIVSLKPDLVLMLKWGSKVHYDEMVKRGVPVFVLDFLTVDDLIRIMLSISSLIKSDESTVKKINSFSNHVEILFEVARKYLEGKRFFVMYSYPDIYTASSNSFVASMIRKFGGVNVSDSFPYQYQTIMVSLERLIRMKPDVIVISDPKFNLITNELFKYGVTSKFVFVDPMHLSPSLGITNFVGSIVEQLKKF